MGRNGASKHREPDQKASWIHPGVVQTELIFGGVDFNSAGGFVIRLLTQLRHWWCADFHSKICKLGLVVPGAQNPMSWPVVRSSALSTESAKARGALRIFMRWTL